MDYSVVGRDEVVRQKAEGAVLALDAFALRLILGSQIVDVVPEFSLGLFDRFLG